MNDLDLLTALREADSAPPAPEARAAARSALLEEASRRRPALRGRRPWLFAGAGAAVTAAVALALITGLDSGQVAPPAAKAALERAARAAQLQAGHDLAPGEYLYIRERDAYLATAADQQGGWSMLAPSTRETWVGRDGGGRYVERGGKDTFVGPRDRARWIAAGRPDTGGGAGTETMDLEAHGFTAGSGDISYEQLAALPSDGEAMYDRLIELAGDAGSSPDSEAFVIIGDLLRSAPVPARVRAGLYRAAAYIKGVRYVGAVTDGLGRRGLAIELDNPEASNRLVFDPETSQLLAEEEVLTKRVAYMDADPGFVTGSRVVLETAVVGSVAERPAKD